MAHSAEISAELLCDRCGYDLRAQPKDGKCPECGTSVAESQRLAAIPRRPSWRDSDPRWRRRMLAGVWILVFIPLMDVLMAFGWASNIRVPNIFDLQGNFHTLDETLLSFQGVYQPLVFCIGMALLFSKERLRRGSPLDWTRRWGIICSYIVLLLSAMILLFIGALILAGIGALFMSMPLKYQPGVTRLFVDVSTGYLFYGASPTNRSEAVLVAFSSITVLLCCVPLLNALRSSGPKFLAAILLAPLALFALINLVQAGRYWLGFSSSTSGSVLNYNVYFYPMLFARYFGDQKYLTYLTNMSGSEFSIFLIEATKWCIILTIAIWLTIAQIDAWRQNKKAGDQ